MIKKLQVGQMFTLDTTDEDNIYILNDCTLVSQPWVAEDYSGRLFERWVDGESTGHVLWDYRDEVVS